MRDSLSSKTGISFKAAVFCARTLPHLAKSSQIFAINFTCKPAAQNFAIVLQTTNRPKWQQTSIIYAQDGLGLGEETLAAPTSRTLFHTDNLLTDCITHSVLT